MDIRFNIHATVKIEWKVAGQMADFYDSLKLRKTFSERDREAGREKEKKNDVQMKVVIYICHADALSRAGVGLLE